MNIKIDFQDTINKAGRLEELAEDISTICNQDVQGMSDGLVVNWEGEGCNHYRKKLDQINTSLKNKSKTLKVIASGLGRSARNLQRVEEMAKSIF